MLKRIRFRDGLRPYVVGAGLFGAFVAGGRVRGWIEYIDTDIVRGRLAAQTKEPEGIYDRAAQEFVRADPDLDMSINRWRMIAETSLPHVVGYVIADVTNEMMKYSGHDLSMRVLKEKIEEHYGL